MLFDQIPCTPSLLASPMRGGSGDGEGIGVVVGGGWLAVGGAGVSVGPGVGVSVAVGVAEGGTVLVGWMVCVAVDVSVALAAVVGCRTGLDVHAVAATATSRSKPGMRVNRLARREVLIML